MCVCVFCAIWTVKEVFHSVPKSEQALRAQMAYMLGEQRMFILDDDAEGAAMAEDDDQVAALRRQINNSHLSEAYLVLAEDLDVLEPKIPEDMYVELQPHTTSCFSQKHTRFCDSYKSHLETTRGGGAASVDSAKANLAGKNKKKKKKLGWFI